MAKKVKLLNDNYLDTSSGVHNGIILKTYLDNLENNVNNLNNTKQDKSVVYYNKLTTNIDKLEINNLNLTEGNIYRMVIASPDTTKTDLNMKINNITSAVYQTIIGTNVQDTTTNTVGNATTLNSQIRLNNSQGVYYGFSLFGKDTIIDSIITIINGKASVQYKSSCVRQGGSFFIEGQTTCTQTLTQIDTLTLEPTSKILPAGMTICIYKINNT